MKIELSSEIKTNLFVLITIYILIGISFYIGGYFLENPEIELNYLQNFSFISCKILTGISVLSIIFGIYLYITKFYTYLKKNIKIKKD